MPFSYRRPLVFGVMGLLLVLLMAPCQRLQAQIQPDTSLANDEQVLPEELPQPDSGKIDLAYTTHGLFQSYTDSFRTYDTTLGRLHQYQRIYQLPSFAEDLGNIGTPVYRLYPEWNPALGFRPGLDYGAYYRHRFASIRYYDVPRPLSLLEYVQGDEEMQVLRLRHTQNFTPLWNASLRYDRIVSQGFYFNQETGLSDVLLTTNASSHNHHYRLFAHAYFQTLKNQENGGMESDSAFRAEDLGNRVRLPVKLDRAFAVSRYRRYYLDQYYLLGAFQADTLPDSVYRSRQMNEAQQRSYVRLENRLERWEYRFEEDQRNADDFGAAFYDPDTTRDLTQAWHYQSRLATRWAPQLGRLGGAKLTTGLAQHLARYQGRYIQTQDFQYSQADASLDVNLGPWKLLTQATSILQGDFLGNYRVEARTEWRSRDSLFELGLRAANWQQAPERKAALYAGNYTFYDKALSDENHTHFEGRLRIPSTRSEVSAFIHRATNWTYYNRNRSFSQLDEQLGYIGFRLRQDVVWGGYHLQMHGMGQRWLQEDVPLALPDWAAKVSTFYQFHLFERVLLLRIGVDGRWHSRFLGNNYQAFIAEFAPQRQLEVGDYPVLDAWLSGQVKDFRFFAKLEHLNRSWTERVAYTLPGYPIFPTVFRFGIRWRLLD